MITNWNKYLHIGMVLLCTLAVMPAAFAAREVGGTGDNQLPTDVIEPVLDEMEDVTLEAAAVQGYERADFTGAETIAVVLGDDGVPVCGLFWIRFSARDDAVGNALTLMQPIAFSTDSSRGRRKWDWVQFITNPSDNPLDPLLAQQFDQMTTQYMTRINFCAADQKIIYRPIPNLIAPAAQ